MRLKTLFLLLIVIAMGALATLNWAALATPATVSLGVMEVQAPLGLIMLALTALLCVFFLVYVLTLQGSVLMETRRHAKEMTVQRELADRAEASRFTELRTFLEAQHRSGHQALLERLDTLEARILARVLESDNSTAACVGQLEDQLRHRD
ncbi:LapA family protein [Diaphorobacter sp.]|uniref:LapA family protein n=1 Tax=Diaphorobacter sp. TaxID=1934310 RepID=UPI003D13B8D1